ncbi:MAG: hypothetical protein JWN60_921 [Acidobacteria bacterium]|jgi:hypothetical protein|nr:hypothetical protein [Acidobacteriota bacterium]
MCRAKLAKQAKKLRGINQKGKISLHIVRLCLSVKMNYFRSEMLFENNPGNKIKDKG